MPSDRGTLSPSLLAWLRCFDAAARCGSFTKAARELHVSQGAVSQQVRKLEDWLGHALLLRTQAGLALTPQGDQLFPATRDAFRGVEAAVRRLRSPWGGEPVNVSCSPSFAMLWLTLRLGDFYRTHADVPLRIVGEFARAEPARMAREGIAAAIRFGTVESVVPQSVELFDEWLLPVATPAFMQAHPQLRSADDLAGRHLLHANDPCESGPATQEWAQWLVRTGVELPASALHQGPQFNLSQLAVQAALGGQGIAMGRVALVLGYLQQGRLVAPFRCRVRAEGAYHFIGSPHPEGETIRRWLADQSARYCHQRNALFDSMGIDAA